MGERNSYLFGQVMWLGFQRHTIFYDRSRRESGRSRWTNLKKLKYFIDAFTAFSYLPVRLSSLLGFVLAIVGFLYAALIIGLRLAGVIEEPGFTAVMVVVVVAAGVQLIVIGLMGEYLWRVLEESRARPPFLVDTTLNIGADEIASRAGQADWRPAMTSLARRFTLNWQVGADRRVCSASATACCTGRPSIDRGATIRPTSTCASSPEPSSRPTSIES